jgi:hypothetical protein
MDTSKLSTQESLLLLRHHLGNWFRGPAVSKRSELLVAHENLGSSRCCQYTVCPCRVRNKFLVTFETALYFVYALYFGQQKWNKEPDWET